MDQLWTSNGKILTETLPKDWKFRLIYRNGFIHTSSVMLAKDDINLVGGSDESMSRGIGFRSISQNGFSA